MIRFILNDRLLTTDEPPGTVVLDFIRYSRSLNGTKTGCREGDCGACTVLVGELYQGQLRYQSMTACLMPLSNAHGKHLVTIEGINPVSGLNPAQQAIVEEGGTQCGFCTVGFVMSLMGFCLSGKPITVENGVASIDGNICRCTGYKSIERAVERITRSLTDRPVDQLIDWLVQQGFIPAYFNQISQRLAALVHEQGEERDLLADALFPVGGGTDLFVQQPAAMRYRAIRPLCHEEAFKTIRVLDDVCTIGGACSAADLGRSEVFRTLFPTILDYLKLVSSTPIRNMGTVAGNLINASPIGDLSIWLLALDAHLVLRSGSTCRTMPLRQLYQGYKLLDKRSDEVLESLFFRIPKKPFYFNFEKVSKRTHLDIASVNTALLLVMNGDYITRASLSAGGLAPIPLYLAQTSAFLSGKLLNANTLLKANELAQVELSPISDVRGSADYKRLLFRQLFYAHFLNRFPEKINLQELYESA